MQELKVFLKNISKKPHYESYTWGSHVSFFASSFYFIIFIFRHFSLLQLIKQIYRYINRNKNKVEKKERSDFHALYTEWYLLFVFTCFFFNYQYNFSDSFPIVANFIFGYFLLESITWIFYYLFFRILLERHLSIYNEIEYFICLPIVLATQSIIVSSWLNIEGFTATQVFSMALNFSNTQTFNLNEIFIFCLNLLGFIYTAVIIANIIALVPSIPIQRRQNITIIGAGDVVQKRMLDAFLTFYNNKQISIVSMGISSNFKKVLQDKEIQAFDVKNINEIINIIKNRSSFAIIATPTQFHYEYMVALDKEKIPFAVEKPITNFKPYLLELNKNSRIMDNGFLLSYYWLEKALSLNYFLTLNPEYKEYINIIKTKRDDNSIDSCDLNTLQLFKNELGTLKQIKIQMIENKELKSREWSLRKENGGMIFETLIHAFTLLYNICDQSLDYSLKKIDWKKSDNIHTTGVIIEGSYKKCNFEIEVDKKSKKDRFLKVEYSNGNINLNIEDKECTITLNTGENIKLSIKKYYLRNYTLQVHLIDKFIQNGSQWQSIRFDDYPNQISLLLYLYDNLYKNWLNQDEPYNTL